MSSVTLYFFNFLKKASLNNSTYCFFFDAKDSSFKFHPGQYVQMTLPHVDPDDRGTSRFFTIASSPTEKYLMIISRKGKSSFKKALFDLEPGTKVQFFGPIGTFTLPEH